MLFLPAEELKAIKSKREKSQPEGARVGSPEGATRLYLSACKDVPFLASRVFFQDQMDGRTSPERSPPQRPPACSGQTRIHASIT